MHQRTAEPETLPFADSEIGRDEKTMCLVAKLFNGFSNPTRLSILLALARRGETRVADLVEELKAPQPRVSDHLTRLLWCGYVSVRREGRYAYYSVSDERVLQMIGLCMSIMEENVQCGPRLGSMQPDAG